MTEKLYVLTVKQPWAGLIIHGVKDVENRTRPISYRGPLLIHAGKQFDGEGMDRLHATKAAAAIDCIAVCRMPLGVILGTVDLVDCVQDSSSEWAEEGMYHWLLANPQAFDVPIPWRGQQGLWNIDAAQLEAAKRSVAR